MLNSVTNEIGADSANGSLPADGSSLAEGSFSVNGSYGETPLAYAPRIELANGELAVPQQFLDVDRQLDNLCNVLLDIDLPDSYQLFAGQEGSCLYLIVGVIGHENYVGYRNSVLEDKIVYGRRWLIEPSTPTSEIVQTALLAVQKVREHEARELFTLRVNQGRNLTTPFNCHLDLPLMAGNRSVLNKCQDQEPTSLANLLNKVRFAGLSFKIIQEATLTGSRLIELAFVGKSRHFPELNGTTIAVHCRKADDSDFLHQLINVIIEQSDRYIEEQLSFKDFRRFSHDVCPQKIAKFSYTTRNIEITDPRFDRSFEDMSYKVDAAKAPAYNTGELGQKQRAAISGVEGLAGYLPRELTA